MRHSRRGPGEHLRLCFAVSAIRSRFLAAATTGTSASRDAHRDRRRVVRWIRIADVTGHARRVRDRRLPRTSTVTVATSLVLLAIEPRFQVTVPVSPLGGAITVPLFTPAETNVTPLDRLDRFRRYRRAYCCE